MDRQPLKLNTQWLPNPNQQFTSPPPKMPPPTLQNGQGARIIPHLPTGGTFPILAHAHTSHYPVLKQSLADIGLINCS